MFAVELDDKQKERLTALIEHARMSNFVKDFYHARFGKMEPEIKNLMGHNLKKNKIFGENNDGKGLYD